jgi:hypothetical protein
MKHEHDAYAIPLGQKHVDCISLDFVGVPEPTDRHAKLLGFS